MSPEPDSSLAALERARRRQDSWARLPIAKRLAVLRRFRHLLADHAQALAATVTLPQRTSDAETYAAELLPLADACRFLEKRAARLLAPRRLGARGRPFWLAGAEAEIRREPHGVVLVIAPSNYPILLPGVQTLQSLAAGNAVLLKPGRGGRPAARMIADLLIRAGLDEGLLTVLQEAPTAASAAIDRGVDKVLLTGSLATGREVLRRMTKAPTPAVMELSGCDAVFVRDDADLDLVGRALRFGLTFNSGFTCIAPRRVFATGEQSAALARRLAATLQGASALPVGEVTAREVQRLAQAAIASGARLVSGRLPDARAMTPLVLAEVDSAEEILRADLAAPVVSLVTVADQAEALAIARDCPFALGAAIFGDADAARSLADEVDAGVVVINDLIVPTADPRLPFGGRGASGFGVTRGAEGLLELTQLKVVTLRRGRFRPHYEPTGHRQEDLLAQMLQLGHARTFSRRLRAGLRMLRLAVVRQPLSPTSEEIPCKHS